MEIKSEISAEKSKEERFWFIQNGNFHFTDKQELI